MLNLYLHSQKKSVQDQDLRDLPSYLKLENSDFYPSKHSFVNNIIYDINVEKLLLESNVYPKGNVSQKWLQSNKTKWNSVIFE